MITKTKIKISALLMAVLICSLAFVSTVNAKTTEIDDKMPSGLKEWIKDNQKTDEERLLMEKKTKEWMQEHTLSVTSTKTYRYKSGELIVEETYSGKEFEEKFKTDEITKEMKIKNPSKEFRSINSNGQSVLLNEGDEVTTTNTVMIVMTEQSSPFEWWNIGYEYPQYSWYQIDNGGTVLYEKADPINIAWENTYRSTVATRIINQGWTDTVIEWAEYVSDPNNGWIEGDGVATSTARLTGGFHVRLFVLSNGDIVGDAHEDSWPLPEHEVIGLENAEDLIAGFFDNDMSNWWVLYDQEELDNEVTSPFSNGEATCIWRVGSQS
ncbi:MAG: hypothetical protein RBT65_08335 [Methanolobus sp.]|nr:hypothetical protein [Methanolobus sp.]